MIKSEKGLVTIEGFRPVLVAEMVSLMGAIEKDEQFRELWKEAKIVKKTSDKVGVELKAERFEDLAEAKKAAESKKQEEPRHAKKDASDKSIDDLLIEMLLKGLN